MTELRPPNAGRLAGILLVLSTLAACEPQTQERAQDAVDEATRKAEKGLEQAREGTRDAVDEATRKAENAARKAEGELADARERLALEQRLEQAKAHLDESMDDAAVAFGEVAESGKQQASDLKQKVDTASKGIEVPHGAISCDDKPESRICKIDPELIARLAQEPRALAREVSLRPKRGSTGRGLQLVRARAESLTTMLGLREGDILLEINGTELSSFEAIRELDEALSGRPEAKLIYERDGKREALTVVQQAGG